MRISDWSSDVCSSDLIDFLVKPVRPRELRARCRNLLQLRQQAESVKQRALSLEQRLLSSMHEVEERERETLTRLARAIAYRDSGTSANLERLARIAGMVAAEMGMIEDEVRMIAMPAPPPALGKIAIPHGSASWRERVSKYVLISGMSGPLKQKN